MGRIRHSIIVDEDAIDKLMNEAVLDITQCGILRVNDPGVSIMPPIYSDRIIYVCQGRACITRDDNPIDITKGELTHLAKDEQIKLDYNCLPFEAYYVNFILSDVSKKVLKSGVRFLPHHKSKDINKALLVRFRELIEVAEQGGLANYFKFKSMFNILLVEILRIGYGPEKGLQDATKKVSNTLYIYNQACELIIDNAPQIWKVKDLAMRLNISVAYLYQVFSKHAGKSPQLYLTEYRVQLAKDYLKYENQTVKNIAYRLGFGSPNQFSSYFKLNVGMTPQEYRKALRL